MKRMMARAFAVAALGVKSATACRGEASAVWRINGAPAIRFRHGRLA
jgi:hypothetical protein